MKLKLREFVQQLSDIVDVQFSQEPSLTKLPIDPRDKSMSSRTAHHMLLVASVDQRSLVGVAENARRLLCHCHQQLGDKLYTVEEERTFAEAIVPFRSQRPLGQSSAVIPRILASTNRFVSSEAKGNLVQWGTQFELPSQIAEAISTGIYWMGATPNSTRRKMWMYMRWMVRPYPDLRIWEELSPKDLFVPVDYNVAKVASSFRLPILSTRQKRPKSHNRCFRGRSYDTESMRLRDSVLAAVSVPLARYALR